MHQAISLALLALLALLFSACEGKQPSITHTITHNCQYYSLKSAQCKSKKEMIRELQPYPIIFIGDHHSENDLHTNIGKLIKDLSDAGTKVKLANEWFYPSDNKILEAFTSEDINETEFLKKIKWKKRFKYYEYDSFRPMYEAVKETQGKLYGINLSKAQRKKISDQNLSGMSENEKLFNARLDINVSAHQGLVMPYLSHCHAPKKDESLDECTKRMYKVQVAWDTKMALESYKLSQTLEENEKLIIFAGSMHIENRLGIPLRFSRLSNLPTATIIPAEQRRQNLEHGLGDFVILYQKKEASKD